MLSYAGISAKIIKTYEMGEGEVLENYRRFHWYIRRYRMTGEERYKDEVYKSFLIIKPKIIKTFDSLSTTEGIIKHSKDFLSGYKKQSLRKELRFLFYQDNPEVTIYLSALDYLFTLKSLGLDGSPEIKALYEKGVEYFENNDVSEILLSPEFVRIYPSGSANMINFLAFLGISDNRQKQIDISEIYWQTIEPENHGIWLDKIYALTHIVIASSNYYQNVVKREEFEWIFKYFEENIEEILKTERTDAIAEVGLSFKLIGDFENQVLVKVKDYLAQRFDEGVGYIPKETALGINKAEHRNILAVMVLSDYDKLYKGPNIGDLV